MACLSEYDRRQALHADRSVTYFLATRCVTSTHIPADG